MDGNVEQYVQELFEAHWNVRKRKPAVVIQQENINQQQRGQAWQTQSSTHKHNEAKSTECMQSKESKAVNTTTVRDTTQKASSPSVKYRKKRVFQLPQ